MKRTVTLLLAVIICALMLYPAYAAENEEADIPQIKIVTESGEGTSLKKSDGYINANISFVNNGAELDEKIVMKVRGNSTAFDSIGKKSFTFKFDKKKNLFSMGSGKKWALISNVFDPTLARNYTAFSIAHQLGITYASEFKVVELWLDDSFRGCYLLMEPVGEGKDRVNIDIEANEGKKDFLLELEKSRDESDVTYITSNGIRFAISEPDEPEDEQVSYIQGVTDDVINTLKSGNVEDIQEKIDVNSFVKFYLLNEFLKPVDFDFSSVFYYYKDGKFYAGPPWDYDLSMGNVNETLSANSTSASKTDGLFADKNLFKFLYHKQWFKEKVKELYTENYLYFNSLGAENGVIDTFYKTYKPAIDRNFAIGVWNVSRYWINVQKTPLPTYEENYNFLLNWCGERARWLTEYLDIDTSQFTTATPDEPSTSPETAALTETSEPETDYTEAQTSIPQTLPSETQELTESSEPQTVSNTTAPVTETVINPTAPSVNTQPASYNTDPSETNAKTPSLKKTGARLKAGETSAITVFNKGNNKVSYKSSDEKAVIVRNGRVAALRKGFSNITVSVGKTKLIYKVRVTTSPKLSKKSVTIKKGKTKSVRIIGKSSFVKNKYSKSKLAKIISKKSAKRLKIRGLKKGRTTLKVKVNGVKLKLKVKVK